MSPSQLYSTAHIHAGSSPSLSSAPSFPGHGPAYRSEYDGTATGGSTLASIALPHASLESVGAMSVDRLLRNDSPEQRISRNGMQEHLLSLIQTGWNADLPDPKDLER